MATPNATTIVDSGIVVMDVVGAGGGIPPLSCGSIVVRQYYSIVIAFNLNILLPVPVAQFLTMKTMMTTGRIVRRKERACHLFSYG